MKIPKGSQRPTEKQIEEIKKQVRKESLYAFSIFPLTLLGFFLVYTMRKLKGR